MEWSLLEISQRRLLLLRISQTRCPSLGQRVCVLKFVMIILRSKMGKTYMTAELPLWRGTLRTVHWWGQWRQDSQWHESCYRLARGRERLLLSGVQGLPVHWKWRDYCLAGLQCPWRRWRVSVPLMASRTYKLVKRSVVLATWLVFHSSSSTQE